MNKKFIITVLGLMLFPYLHGMQGTQNIKKTEYFLQVIPLIEKKVTNYKTYTHAIKEIERPQKLEKSESSLSKVSLKKDEGTFILYFKDTNDSEYPHYIDVREFSHPLLQIFSDIVRQKNYKTSVLFLDEQIKIIGVLNGLKIMFWTSCPRLCANSLAIINPLTTENALTLFTLQTLEINDSNRDLKTIIEDIQINIEKIKETTENSVKTLQIERLTASDRTIFTDKINQEIEDQQAQIQKLLIDMPQTIKDELQKALNPKPLESNKKETLVKEIGSVRHSFLQRMLIGSAFLTVGMLAILYYKCFNSHLLWSLSEI